MKTFDLDGLTAHVNMTHPVSRSMVRVYAQHLEKAGVSEKHGQRAEKIVCPFEEYGIESTAASGCQRGVRPEYKRNCIKGGS